MSFRIGLSFHLDEYFDYLRQQCEALGIRDVEVVKVDMKTNSEDETIEKMSGFDAIAAMNETYSARVLDALKESGLKVLCRHGIGYDKVDVQHAASIGICCANTPGTMSTGVAETAMILILECTRQLYKHYAELKNGIWDKGPATGETAGKTVGLFGFGNIAKQLAKYLQGFDVKLIASDINFDEAAAKELNVEQVTPEELIARSDYLSVHIPHTPETQGMIDADFLSKMKPTAYLINTARGKIVDEPALIEALKNGVIAGAGLDVFYDEPVSPDNELLKLDNVYCTPHVATNTADCTAKGFQVMSTVFADYLNGKVPASCLNPGYAENL